MLPMALLVVASLGSAFASQHVVSVPDVIDEIHRLSTGVVFAAVPFPVFPMLQRHPQIDRLRRWDRRRRWHDDHGWATMTCGCGYWPMSMRPKHPGD